MGNGSRIKGCARRCDVPESLEGRSTRSETAPGVETSVGSMQAGECWMSPMVTEGSSLPGSFLVSP